MRIPRPSPQPPLAVRLRAARKSAAATALAQQRLRRKARQQGWQVQPESLLYAAYVMVLSTFPTPAHSTRRVLEAYRLRWQVELVFKRLKPMAQPGRLPKHDPESSHAWLYRRLFVALLTEKFIQSAAAISPCGYHLGDAQGPPCPPSLA